MTRHVVERGLRQESGAVAHQLWLFHWKTEWLKLQLYFLYDLNIVPLLNKRFFLILVIVRLHL